jgi:Fe-S-cluster containining protein
MKDCNQCGKCCINYSDGGLSATAGEIEYWEIFRPAIYRYVSGGKIWMDPETKQQLTRCPWLRELPVENSGREPSQKKYTCDIYHDRPDDCKHFPVTIAQMVENDCEMIEVKDLSDPKQAQKKLDQLMAGSRPPLN